MDAKTLADMIVMAVGTADTQNIIKRLRLLKQAEIGVDPNDSVGKSIALLEQAHIDCEGHPVDLPAA